MQGLEWAKRCEVVTNHYVKGATDSQGMAVPTPLK